jgi:hypothetical protein
MASQREGSKNFTLATADKLRLTGSGEARGLVHFSGSFSQNMMGFGWMYCGPLANYRELPGGRAELGSHCRSEARNDLTRGNEW